MLSPMVTSAQIINATLPDQPITAPTVPQGNYTTINCDMVQRTPQGGTLKAIAWDNKQFSNGSYNSNVSVFVEDENGNSLVFNSSVDFAVEPDIVIADDVSAPGNNYVVCLIYNTGNPNLYYYYDSCLHQIRLDYWRISNVGSPSLSASLIGSQTLSDSATGNPHIDLWTDSSYLVDGWKPILQELAAVWTDSVTTTNNRYNIAYYHNTVPNFTNSKFYSGQTIGYKYPDVACRTEINSSNKFYNEKIMDLAFTRSNGNWSNTGSVGTTHIYYWKYNSTLSSFPPSPPFQLDNASYALPRIESMSQDNQDLHPGGHQWQVCAIVNGGMMPWRAKGYNGNFDAGSYNSLQLSLPYFPADNIAPAVTAGVGLDFYDPYNSGVLNIGNQSYFNGFYPRGNASNYVYAREVNAAGGWLLNPRAFQINRIPITPWINDHIYGLAVSSSSNTGYGILSAWYDGVSFINYKVIPNNAVVFKPAVAGLNEPHPIIKNVSLYPNPATETIRISHIESIGDYRIIDLSGRLITTGNTVLPSLSISHIASGTYYLQFRNGTVNYQLLFTKN